MTTINKSKVDGLHRYLNDVVVTLGVVVLTLSVAGVLGYRKYNSHQATQQRTAEQCPLIAAKFSTRYRLEAGACSIQTSDGSWIGINIQ